jgi:hypothetical protein
MLQTRAQRFLVLRDAVMAHRRKMRFICPGEWELRCGPFGIMYMLPGARHGRGHNLQIWPGGKQDRGLMLYENKVANVDWGENDEVHILSYRSGPWESELLSLLSAGSNVSLFQWRDSSFLAVSRPSGFRAGD